MVDRSILWNKLQDMGFGGEFLAALKSIYHNDSIKAAVTFWTFHKSFSYEQRKLDEARMRLKQNDRLFKKLSH